MIGFMTSANNYKLLRCKLDYHSRKALLAVFCPRKYLNKRQSSPTKPIEASHLGATWVLARMNFLPFFGLTDPMRGWGIGDLAGKVVHGP